MEYWPLTLGIAGLLLLVILLVNALIRKKNQVEFAFASVDAQLKRRYDLIPNLVSTCERYMGYEEKLLRELAGTRERFLAAPQADAAADVQLTGQLRSVFALAESYPALRASENFVILQQSLNEVEEQLAASRRAFNAAVTDYNNACQQFPTNMLASMMGLKVRPWFEATPVEREPVRVWR